MAELNLNGATTGNALQELLVAPDIEPGDEPSYQTCKVIYTFHPLGAKMAESPVKMAQSQAREIAVTKGPEDRLREKFLEQWRLDNCDRVAFQTKVLSRVYGLASVALVVDGVEPSEPVNYETLADKSIGYNVFDPLNTAGSCVLSQQPNSIDFLKTTSIRVSGAAYHRSRSCIVVNEQPIYLAYTQSAFGFVGRSVYQRALYPLKSFINTMRTDNMVARKAGLLIAKMEPAGSIVSGLMSAMAGVKRALLVEAQTDNVLSISPEEEITSLDLQNLDGASTAARKNILENIAAAADMPAKLLLQETFAEGFGEGTEDAKYIAGYIEGLRTEMGALYAFLDKITRHRAWTPGFFEALRGEFPEEFGSKTFTEAFTEWSNSFAAQWPSLLKEPDSEKIKVDDVKLKAVIALVEVLAPQLDPENKATLIQWACDNFNELKLMFGTPLQLDIDALMSYEPPQPDLGLEGDEEQAGSGKPPKPPRPFADSATGRRLADAVAALPVYPRPRQKFMMIDDKQQKRN